MRRVPEILCLFFVFPLLKCVENYTEKFKQLSHFDRYKVEELSNNFNTAKNEEVDPNLNLVAFLVKNAKEIFGETEETTFVFKLSPRRTETTTSIFSSPNSTTNFIKFINSINLATSESITSKSTIFSEDELLVLNITRPLEVSVMTREDRTSTTITEPTETSTELSTELTTERPTERFTDFFTETTINVKSVRETLLNLTNTEKPIVKPMRTLTRPTRTDDTPEIDYSNHSETDTTTMATKISPLHARSCIVCNNVESQYCNNPETNLSPSIKCSHEEDLCYSQQTPFGIVDRGCFNVNHNMTTYVCACNLCNYISISEMPYVFTKKKEWVDNVVDLTRTKGFRSSIYKDMLCLSCEVNTTIESTFNMAYTANCLEGNIGVLKTQKCSDDEICGVKTLKSEGYVWRGCLKSPLYNYWWSLCDNDLCNNDPLFTLFDPP